jgi:hypothetical protein
MLAGIDESVMCPAVSHMTRVYFHIGALSCITSDFLAVKVSELTTDHSPLSNTEVWNAESFSFMSVIQGGGRASGTPSQWLLGMV